MANHHFISYSSADGKDFALKLAGDLKNGPPPMSVWIDKEQLKPGIDWDEQILQGIVDCHTMLFVMTADSVKSSCTCKQEWTTALGLKKIVVPIQLNKSVVTPFRLGSRQFADFTGNYEIALADLRKYLIWLDSPGGELQALEDQKADIERSLARTEDNNTRKSLENSYSQLNAEIFRRKQILNHQPVETDKPATGTINKKLQSSAKQYPILDQFEIDGNYAEAIKWVDVRWSSIKSWDLLARYLHLYILLGEAGDGLSRFIQLKETLSGVPSPEMEHAIQYYDGRMRGQLTWITDALNLHRKNVSYKNLEDVFQWRSLFEIAQLSYRIEDFKTSRTEYQRLLGQLEEYAIEDWSASILPRVLNYLATFEMIHIVYDFPFTQVQSGDWQLGSAEACLEFAEKSYENSMKTNNLDGAAWALASKGFGFEGLGEFEKANDEYQKSIQILRSGKGQRTSLIYILTYYAGFYRRQHEFECASKLLSEATEKLPADARAARGYKAYIYDHLVLLCDARGDKDAARDNFFQAMTLYAKDAALQNRFEWPLVQRLRRTCAEKRFDFNDFFPK